MGAISQDPDSRLTCKYWVTSWKVLVTSHQHLGAKFCFHEVMYCHSVCRFLLSLSLCWPYHNQENSHIISRQSKSTVFATPYHVDQNLCLILCGWHCVPWVSGKGRTLSRSNIDLSLRWERIWIQHWSLGGSPLVSLEAALNFETVVHSFSHPNL